MSDEQFYDENIAPKLLDLGKLCEEHGLSICCTVEWSPEDRGHTIAFSENASTAMKIIKAAALCKGNVDAMFTAIIKLAKQVGHGSIYLTQLGVGRGKQPQSETDSQP